MPESFLTVSTSVDRTDGYEARIDKARQEMDGLQVGRIELAHELRAERHAEELRSAANVAEGWVRVHARLNDVEDEAQAVKVRAREIRELLWKHSLANPPPGCMTAIDELARLQGALEQRLLELSLTLRAVT